MHYYLGIALAALIILLLRIYYLAKIKKHRAKMLRIKQARNRSLKDLTNQHSEHQTVLDRTSPEFEKALLFSMGSGELKSDQNVRPPSSNDVFTKAHINPLAPNSIESDIGSVLKNEFDKSATETFFISQMKTPHGLFLDKMPKASSLLDVKLVSSQVENHNEDLKSAILVDSTKSSEQHRQPSDAEYQADLDTVTTHLQSPHSSDYENSACDIPKTELRLQHSEVRKIKEIVGRIKDRKLFKPIKAVGPFKTIKIQHSSTDKPLEKTPNAFHLKMEAPKQVANNDTGLSIRRPELAPIEITCIGKVCTTTADAAVVG